MQFWPHNQSESFCPDNETLSRKQQQASSNDKMLIESSRKMLKITNSKVETSQIKMINAQVKQQFSMEKHKNSHDESWKYWSQTVTCF